MPFMRLVVAITAFSAAVPFGAAGQKNPQYSAFSERLSGSERTAQALDRLTFGPRPGDSEEVERVGLRKWIEWQLHPERITDALLVSKLKPYASLSMKSRDLLLHYPNAQFIREIAQGRQASPADPELRLVTDQLVARYLRKQAQGNNGAAGDENIDFAPQSPLSALLSSAQMETLRHGRPEDKRVVLDSIPPDQQSKFALALRPGQRKALLPLAPVPLQRKLLLSLSPQQVVLTDLASAKILRAIYSERQLEEEMVDFWFNHFNIYFNKGADRYLTTEYEREAIRPHVFGKFYDLLLATAKSPAMMFYLDNAESVSPNAPPRSFARSTGKQVKRGLNENYGRELMELHTLGVDGGYTQRDVIEVARCFTGWTISPPRRGGEFRFDARLHDYGPKVVLGHVIHAGGGISDGLEVLKILAKSPATAHHISLELATRFVADNPPPSLVDRMTAKYLKTGGDIRAVLETMIFSPEFFSKGAYRVKVKTPFEMVVSAVRTSGAEVESPLALDRQIAHLGEPLYLKIEPTGYSNANAEWMSTASLLGRMNFALALSKNHVPGVSLAVKGGEQLAAMLGSPDFQRR